MTEYMHLVGAEEVSRAANRMSEAAQEMKQAAANIDNSLFQQRQFMDDWLTRFEAALAHPSEEAHDA